MLVGDPPESVTLGGWRCQVTVTADEFGVRWLLIDGIPDDAGEFTLEAGGCPSPVRAELLTEIEDHRNAEIGGGEGASTTDSGGRCSSSHRPRWRPC